MKKIILVMLLLLPLGAWAQDVIVKKDGSTVVCRVEKVSDTDVTYKLWTDLQGSSYIIDKSLISAINYENGTKTTFDGAKAAAGAESTKPMTDDELLKMASTSTGKKMLTPAEAQIKRLKLIGWIGGGTLVAVGTIMIGVGISNGYSGEKAYTSTYTYEGKTYSHYFPGVSGFTDWGLIAPGMVALAGGIATTTGCLVKAHKLMQQSPYSVNASPLYRQEFRLKNGASLATGVDFLKDNTRHNPTLGIGLSYNF